MNKMKKTLKCTDLTIYYTIDDEFFIPPFDSCSLTPAIADKFSILFYVFSTIEVNVKFFVKFSASVTKWNNNL